MHAALCCLYISLQKTSFSGQKFTFLLRAMSSRPHDTHNRMRKKHCVGLRTVSLSTECSGMLQNLQAYLAAVSEPAE